MCNLLFLQLFNHLFIHFCMFLFIHNSIFYQSNDKVLVLSLINNWLTLIYISLSIFLYLALNHFQMFPKKCHCFNKQFLLFLVVYLFRNNQYKSIIKFLIFLYHVLNHLNSFLNNSNFLAL
jgi:hypothetical protein